MDGDDEPRGGVRSMLQLLGSIAACSAAAGLLATFLWHAAGRTSGRITCQRSTFARAGLMAITDALESFALENDGRCPSELAELARPDSRGLSFLAVDGPPLDPWDRPYLYDPPPDAAAPFRVATLGQDGRPGGEGEDADLEFVRERAARSTSDE